MVVSELIELLQKLPQDSIVILSSDEEGNSFRELETFSIFAGDGWNAEEAQVGLMELTPELAEHGYSEEDVIENAIPCVILG